MSSGSSCEQLVLPFPSDENSLRDNLERAAGINISLTVTDNSTCMISVRRRRSGASVRLHRIFLSAGGDIINEIAALITRGRGRTPLTRDFISRNRGLLRKPPSRRSAVRTEGRYHDLARFYNSLNRRYFEDAVTALITWGTRSPKRSVRRRTLGSYSSQNGLIRINPLLDKRTVPSHFVEFIVYHEMLHAAMGAEFRGGRRSVHSREFRRREKLFRGYDKAMQWEKEHRHRL